MRPAQAHEILVSSRSWVSACSGAADQVGGQDRNLDLVLDGPGQILAPTRFKGDGFEPVVHGLVIGRGDIDGVNPGLFQPLGHLHALRQFDALTGLTDAAVVFVHGQTHADREICPHVRMPLMISRRKRMRFSSEPPYSSVRRLV